MTENNTQSQSAIPVFVASTYTDLMKHRGAVHEALEDLDVVIHGIEDFRAGSEDPLEACKEEIGRCRVFIGIFAMRYGTIPEGQDRSFIHYEYDEAQRLGLSSLICLIDEDEYPILPKYVDKGASSEKLEQFKAELRDKHTVEYFTAPETLKKTISEAVDILVKEEQSKDYERKRSEIQQDLDDAETELNDAQAEMDVAKAALEAALKKTKERTNRIKYRCEQAKQKLDDLDTQHVEVMGLSDKLPAPLRYRTGSKFCDGVDYPLMIVVPHGTFRMGSPNGEIDRVKSEGPVHQVRIEKSFAVGIYPVTFTEWDKCVEDGGCSGYRPRDRGWGREKRPVINISWNDAQGYTEWLRERTGRGYRLLSESEWEYIARAGTKTAFHFGESITVDQANYDGDQTYGSGVRGINRRRTTEVGGFEANGFGLYDVHGNVWEWVEDCWKDSYEGTTTDGSARIDGDNSYRVLRGGSWGNGPGNLRAANRFGNHINTREVTIGFRIAMTL